MCAYTSIYKPDAHLASSQWSRLDGSCHLLNAKRQARQHAADLKQLFNKGTSQTHQGLPAGRHGRLAIDTVYSHVGKAGDDMGEDPEAGRPMC